MFKQKLEHLDIFGFIEKSNDSEWEGPYFTQKQPKTNQLYLQVTLEV